MGFFSKCFNITKKKKHMILTFKKLALQTVHYQNLKERIKTITTCYLSLSLSSLKAILSEETVGLRKSQSLRLQQVLQTALLRLRRRHTETFIRYRNAKIQIKSECFCRGFSVTSTNNSQEVKIRRLKTNKLQTYDRFLNCVVTRLQHYSSVHRFS